MLQNTPQVISQAVVYAYNFLKDLKRTEIGSCPKCSYSFFLREDGKLKTTLGQNAYTLFEHNEPVIIGEFYLHCRRCPCTVKVERGLRRCTIDMGRTRIRTR